MWWYFDLVTQLLIKDLKVKYKSTFLGYFWSLGTPLIMAIILEVAFKQIMRVNIENYGLFLISSLFAWQWFSNSVTGSTWSFIGNSGIIKKINFPRFLVPFSTAVIDGLHFILAIPIIMAFLWWHDKPIAYFSWLWLLPLLVLFQLLICYGLALIVSSVNTIFRDMERIISLGVMMLMYLTPVLFPLTMIPKEYVIYFQFNPMTSVVESWHLLFLEGTYQLDLLVNMGIVSIVVLLLGAWTYNRLSPRFAEVL